MSPAAPTIRWPADRHHRAGIVWSSVIAILFATFAASSFAVDQTVTVSILANLPIEAEGR